ncbi:putative cellular retinaldehyde-binding triple function protein [Neofusicoccum parvum UCRNP2]|uniref:Putative cellular retinaldehyde-binding triple function protein n=1 Tax=Botryosphaeria parva (strain UCR-NP2) TaxID=1287680 RepID=R1GPK8_BOTPV|nr:putative cellular retinaldehyde-binding triple function protein [Neofusicoccum parvum UCRNP2]
MAKEETELQRIDSYQYPAAHLGHLTENQQAALDKFKDLCKDAGYYRPPGVDGKKIASHDDETMLRYLRARKFSPPDALKQFKDTEDWRKENSLDELYDTIDVKEYEETRRLYPQWTGRRDKRGIPVYIFEVAHLNSKNMAAYDSSHKTSQAVATPNSKVPTKMLRLFALYENLTRFVMPLCSAISERGHPETPISQSNNIVDISKVGLKQFWNLKGHMQDASTLATAHYPETLDRIFIIGAPSFFPTVWSWVKRWFDPITVSKIFILTDKTMKETLEQYIDIENIPKKYGGKLDIEFGDMPILEPQIAERLSFQNGSMQKGANTIPTGPIKWEETPDGVVQAVAVGTEAGQPRRQVVATLSATKSLKAMHASSIAGLTPLVEKADPMTSTGTYTQPAEDPAAVIATPTSSSSPAPSESDKTNPTTTSTTADAAPAAAPEQPNGDEKARTGTSETRFAEQSGTHAHNQLAAGTPHEAVNDHGHGDKTVSMEPRTVGQAAKDAAQPLPAADAEPAPPSYAEQAKGVAAAAVEKVAGAVVGGAGKEEAVVEKKVDERVEKMEGPKVEEYLRGQNVSSAAAAA